MESRYIWILDPGHGGIINGEYQTAGKRSPYWPNHDIELEQLYEGEFNRDVVYRIAESLHDEKINYHIVADEYEDTTLGSRTRQANRIYDEYGNSCIYVSVHANYAGTYEDPKLSAHGWEVFTSPGETQSDFVADIFYESMQDMFPDHTFRPGLGDGDVDKEAKFYVLVHTKMPAILTENFFMSNIDECELLLSEDGRYQISQAHLDAIYRIEDGALL